MPRLIALLLLLALAGPVSAEPADLRLLPGWRQADGGHVAGLEIRLPRGWHTYWRSPGAAGIPPSFDWSGSTNLRSVRIEWPHPEVFDSFGTRTIGYRDSVLLPILVEPLDRGRPVELRLLLEFGVCKDICMPAQGEVAARLGPEVVPPAARAPIERALSRRARGPGEAGVEAVRCSFAPNGSGLDLAATVRLRAPSERMTAVIEATARPDLWIGAASARTRGDVVTARARIEAPGTVPVIDRSTLRVTLIEPGRFVQIDGCRYPD